MTLYSGYVIHCNFVNPSEKFNNSRKNQLFSNFADFKWFFKIKTDEGSIAIYDATNVERPVRNALYDFCSKHGFKLFFVESECNDEEIIERTVREVKNIFRPSPRDQRTQWPGPVRLSKDVTVITVGKTSWARLPRCRCRASRTRFQNSNWKLLKSVWSSMSKKRRKNFIYQTYWCWPKLHCSSSPRSYTV